VAAAGRGQPQDLEMGIMEGTKEWKWMDGIILEWKEEWIDRENHPDFDCY
jgi:hypothetical protein